MKNYLGESYYKQYVECTCDAPEHTIRIAYFKDDSDLLYIDTPLTYNYNIWHRIKLAVKYIFGYRSRYGFYQEFVLTPDRVKELKSVLDEFLEDNSKIK